MPQIIPAEIRDTRSGQIWRFPRSVRGKCVSDAEAERIYAQYCPRYSQSGIKQAMRPKGVSRRFNHRERRKAS